MALERSWGGGTLTGVGIRECEVIQWFVEPEARVEQFDKLCEVQSDKASVEVRTPFFVLCVRR